MECEFCGKETSELTLLHNAEGEAAEVCLACADAESIETERARRDVIKAREEIYSLIDQSHQGWSEADSKRYDLLLEKLGIEKDTEAEEMLWSSTP